MVDSPGRALGLDLGTRRVGVAISDGDRTVATPLEVIERTDDRAVPRRVVELVAEWEPTIIVVGLPLHLRGTAGRSVRFVEQEIARLGDTLDLPIVTYDERLSTVTAERALSDGGLSSRAQRSRVDMVAAAVILQGWMDEQRR